MAYLKAAVEKMVVMAVVVALLLRQDNSYKDNKDGKDNGNNNGGSRSCGGGGSGCGGGDGCGGALGKLPLVNNATIMSMMFPTKPRTLTPLQWPRRGKR
jgi:hypothetical protein